MKKRCRVLVVMLIVVIFVGCGKNSVSESESNVVASKGSDTGGVIDTVQESVNVSDIPIGELTEEIVRNYPVANVKDFEYEMDGEGVKIKKYVGDDTVVVIPDTIEGKAVTTINMLVFGNDSEVRGVYFPETVSVIKGTFANNDSIEVIICEGVESIELNACNNCANLHTFILGQNLKTICDFSFFSCPQLRELVIPANFEGIKEETAGGVFGGGTTNLTIIGKSGSTIEAYAKEHGINFQAE